MVVLDLREVEPLNTDYTRDPLDGEDVLLWDNIEHEWRIGHYVGDGFCAMSKKDAHLADGEGLHFASVTFWCNLPPKMD